jgi:hypothetical protein
MRFQNTVALALATTFVLFVISWGLSSNKDEKTILNLSLQDYEDEKHKVDSLNKVVDSLQTEIFYLEDGFDHKEHIYEQVIYDCEHGKNHRETLKRLEINE